MGGSWARHGWQRRGAAGGRGAAGQLESMQSSQQSKGSLASASLKAHHCCHRASTRARSAATSAPSATSLPSASDMPSMLPVSAVTDSQREVALRATGCRPDAAAAAAASTAAASGVPPAELYCSRSVRCGLGWGPAPELP